MTFKFHYYFVFMFFFAINSHAAEVYKWVDENGKLHYSDRPPPEQQAEKMNLKVKSYDQAEIIGKLENYRRLLARTPNAGEVIMYGASWCGYCRKAREYFTDKGISYREYDIETTSKGRRDYKS